MSTEYSKMRVEELRKRLQEAGESTDGTKAVLVERLSALETTSSPLSPPRKRKADATLNNEDTTTKKPKATPKAKAKAQAKGEVSQRESTADESQASTKEKPKAKAKAKAKADAPEGGKDKAPTEADILKDTFPFVRLTTDKDFTSSTHYKIISWNVNGLASLMKTDHLHKLVESEQPDILCLQETKLQTAAAAAVAPLKGYVAYNACSIDKLGYSGTRTYVKESLGGVVTYGLTGQHLEEGRTITLELPQFFLVNTYVPNAGMELERLSYRVETWDVALKAHLQALQAKKPVIWTGDLNVAERDYDRFFTGSYKTMSKSPGFTPEERASFRAVLQELELTDAFRHLYPNAAPVYSFWGMRFNQRAQNKGWRLDYFVLSKALESRLVDTFMLPEVLGSDHCPVVLWLKK